MPSDEFERRQLQLIIVSMEKSTVWAMWRNSHRSKTQPHLNAPRRPKLSNRVCRIKPKKEEPCRISFMSNDSTRYAALLMKLRASHQECSNDSATACLTSLLTERSECYGTRQGSQQSGNLAGHDTLLLDMVRSRSREAEDEVKDQPLTLPCHEILNDENENENDVCIHGYNYNYRTTERSVSRSRVSRISTRRDMDIPSILAFTTFTPAPVCLGIPAFQKMEENRVDIPRWSIRRSVCPVCSQKWKDRSSIRNVKYSGLKRNSSMDLPSIIAPARLRTSVTSGYVPRPVPVAEDKEVGIVRGGFRNSSASWQLTRARRFRSPKLQLPPEATAPPTCSAPTARKDLDLRVSRFLSDEFRCS
ncbi:uncharacterized protein LOC123874124 isoform X2 [Maniola jurtina]|uniref:uncharacterized protein LOC123874124 isoform X2 n=1 Tax=Maniola jurtina TaxID=191418 RepID=UPI001E68D613|nr:uncharacterized protein LOC123874124 isoform X2 [Maniola jurtina]